MPYISDNPIRDFELRDAEQEKSIIKLPKCCECDELIQDDYCYQFDGELICKNCLNENHRESPKNFIMEY